MLRLAIVIPVLNDAHQLEGLLSQLSRLRCAARQRGPITVVVVDGGSRDGTAQMAASAPVVDQTINLGVANRGLQLAAGVDACCGQVDWIWFLHADSRLQPALLDYLQTRHAPGWGRFDIHLEASAQTTRAGRALLAVVASMMNWRSRLTAICTGDQGLFAHVQLLEAIGGVPPQPLMEDVELCKRLRQQRRPACPHLRLGTSARRWERYGVLRTVFAMWRWRWRYWRGEDPLMLAAEYYADG